MVAPGNPIHEGGRRLPTPGGGRTEHCSGARWARGLGKLFGVSCSQAVWWMGQWKIPLVAYFLYPLNWELDLGAISAPGWSFLICQDSDCAPPSPGWVSADGPGGDWTWWWLPRIRLSCPGVGAGWGGEGALGTWGCEDRPGPSAFGILLHGMQFYGAGARAEHQGTLVWDDSVLPFELPSCAPFQKARWCLPLKNSRNMPPNEQYLAVLVRVPTSSYLTCHGARRDSWEAAIAGEEKENSGRMLAFLWTLPYSWLYICMGRRKGWPLPSSEWTPSGFTREAILGPLIL